MSGWEWAVVILIGPAGGLLAKGLRRHSIGTKTKVDDVLSGAFQKTRKIAQWIFQR